MKEVNIKIMGDARDTVLFADGERLNLKKNEFHNYACKYATEKDRIKIELYRELDVGGVLWFITQLFFFVISIFGIFDTHIKRSAVVFDFSAEVDIPDSGDICLKLNRRSESGQAVTLETAFNAQESANEYYVDEKARKTFKLLRIAKVLTAIAVVAIVIISIAASI